jgi:hypothetical protein
MGGSFDIYVERDLLTPHVVVDNDLVVVAPAEDIIGVGGSPNDIVDGWTGFKNAPNAVEIRMIVGLFRVTNNLEEEIEYHFKQVEVSGYGGNVLPPDFRWIAEFKVGGVPNAVPSASSDALGGTLTEKFIETYPDEYYFDPYYAEAGTFQSITLNTGSVGAMITATGANPWYPGDDPGPYPTHAVYTYDFEWWLTSNPGNVTTTRFQIQLFEGTSA